MKLFGFELSISKANVPTATQPISHDRGNWWWPIIREPFTGAWQRNMELRAENITTYFAVYACISLIAQDIGKLRLRLLRKSENGLWEEAESPAFSPLFRMPNHYQTRNQFIEQWVTSKLIHGNTYVLKNRDRRQVIDQLYVLDPTRIKVLVAPDSSVFYELAADNLSGIALPVTVPASEIIHDVMAPLFHPLCGVSPLLAAALPVAQGLNIQRSSSQFFMKGSRPGGMLISPHVITKEQALQYKDEWEQAFTGDNAGKVAILGDGFKYEALGLAAEESQLIEQLKWTAENVCSVFHVPNYMIGVGAAPPALNNIESLQQVYYSQCLQALIEAIESLLDRALLLNVPPINYRTDFDLEDLIRMDTATMIESTANMVKAGISSPNEARRKFNLPPTRGGESPFLQQQNYSLEALAERDAREQAALEQVQEEPDDQEPEEPDDQEPNARGIPDVDRILAIAKSLD
jgi:HK97 family phage portal protein